MLRIRESRAFTMIELIVVIVILGILAAIAAVSYNAVIAKSKDAGVTEVAQQLGKDAQALAAFTAGDAAPATPASELPTALTEAGAGVTAPAGAVAGNFVVHASGSTACLTVGATYADAATVSTVAADVAAC